MTDDKDNDKKTGGEIINFPTGDKIDVSELGIDYVVGQPKSSDTAPEILEATDIAKEYRDRENYVQKSELYQNVVNRESPLKLIDSVIKEIAEELSHLKYDRQKAAKEGKNTSGYTINRISSLRQLAEVLNKRMDNARAEQIDLKSPRFKQILRMWMEFVYESMQKAELPEHLVDLVFKQMEADMINLERKIIESVD